jgi:hypothetical protein
VLQALREDALSSVPGGFELRVGLPWIRALPLAGVDGLSITLDDRVVCAPELAVVLGSRRRPPDAVVEEIDQWWFLQDRLVLAGTVDVAPGRHAVAVDFRMMIPYLPGGPDAPLVLPFHLEAELELDRTVVPSVAGDVGAESVR